MHAYCRIKPEERLRAYPWSSFAYYLAAPAHRPGWLRVDRLLMGWQPVELASRRKHDPDKLAIAARLRRETTLSVRQIASRLHLGTPKSASVRLLTGTRPNAGGDPAQRSLGI